MKEYKEALTRDCSLFDILAWHEGESRELEKWTEIGYFNHIFVSEKGLVTVYYDVKEAEKFDKWFTEKFTEDFFNNLCDDFVQLVEQIKTVNSPEDVFNLSVKMWPALFFFDELSKYPELGNDNMIRRLIRIRKSTETASYELAKKVKADNLPKDYIFYKGEVYYCDFDGFCKERNIVVTN